MLLPKPVKKWIAIFRGEVSPVLIVLSVATGMWFGLTPGFYGLHAALLLIVLVLNVHVGIFLLSAGLGKSLSFAAAPVLFHLGGFTLDHLAGVLGLLAAIPIVGITDFSRYAVAGAVIAGPVLGLLLGAMLARSVVGFRRTWLKLSQDSAKFQAWREKKWIRLLDRFLIGKSTQDVAGVLSRRPKYVRKAGIGLALLLVVVAAGGMYFASGGVLAKQATKSLTDLNGAEVNIAELDLQPLAGKIMVAGFQATDPQQPQRNRVSFEKLEADAGLYPLLLGRVVMDDVAVSVVEFDGSRQSPGRVVRVPEPPAEEEHPFELPDLDARKLEDYFNKAGEIRDALEKIRPYLPEKGEPEPQSAPVPEAYLEYLAARAPSTPSPRLVVSKLSLDKVALPLGPLADSRVECSNLSDAPAAAALPVKVKVNSNTAEDWLEVVSHYESPAEGATVSGEFSHIDLRKVQENLNAQNPVRLRGGTASVKVDGHMSRDFIDLALAIKTQNMELDAGGGGVLGLDAATTSEALKLLKNLETTVRLVGPVAQPRLVLDVPALREVMKNALMKAGKEELARRVGDVMKGKLPEGLPEGVPAEIDTEQLGKDLGGLLGQDKGPDGKPRTGNKAEDHKKDKKKQDSKDAIKDLGGLLGGDKKDDG